MVGRIGGPIKPGSTASIVKWMKPCACVSPADEDVVLVVYHPNSVEWLKAINGTNSGVSKGLITVSSEVSEGEGPEGGYK